MKKLFALLLLVTVLTVGCGVTPKLYYSQEEMWSISRPLWQNKDHKHGFFIYPDSMFVTYIPKKGCVMNYELYDNDYLYLP